MNLTTQINKTVLVSIAIIQLCCGKNLAAPSPYVTSETTNDGWQYASLESVGFDTNLVQQLLTRIDDKTYKNIHSILLVKNGKLVVEKYYPGTDSTGRFQEFRPNTLNEIHSATKSVNSILVGIAIDHHLIRNADEKISDFFPEYSDLFTNKLKSAIQLKDLLSMSAGLAWDEWTHGYSDPRNDAAMMASKADFFRYILEKPMESAPGKKFTYSSGISLMLGEIVHKASGMAADKFAERHLFSPLGITNYYWQKTQSGVVNTLGGLWLRSRDMAKIGQLYLDNGRWNGKQIVSAEWIAQSTKQQLAGPLPSWLKAAGYGYQWWLGSFPVGQKSYSSYSARGRGGQYIIVFPEPQVVAVVTSWNDDVKLLGQPLDMSQRYVLPAVTKKD